MVALMSFSIVPHNNAQSPPPHSLPSIFMHDNFDALSRRPVHSIMPHAVTRRQCDMLQRTFEPRDKLLDAYSRDACGVKTQALKVFELN